MNSGQAMLTFVPNTAFLTFLFILILLCNPIFQKNLMDAVMRNVLSVHELDYFPSAFSRPIFALHAP